MDIKVKFFNYPLQFSIHEKEYMEIIRSTFSRGAFILGEETERFENNLAQFVGRKYAIGVGNCTDALLLSLMAAGVGPGDEVISVSHTFVATIEVIRVLGATPIFVDIADDHNMDVNLVETAINSRTKAIMPVQLNGRICSHMERLVNIAGKYSIPIIEDSAQALGAMYKGKGAGSFGLSGNFSFYPAKLLGAFGDAGAVVTDDKHYAEKVRMLRNHGRGKGTDINMWGLNCRMDNLHAAILDFKLKLLNDWIKRRRQIAAKYHAGLSPVGELRLPPPPVEGTDHCDVFQNYEIEADNRNALMAFLREKKGIEVVVQWGGKAVHQFEGLGLGHVTLPRTEKLFQDSMLLPMYPELQNEQIEYIVRSIAEFYNH
jgi:dTDP-4-amino-4,6-dideoxygalactose transaminase